MQDLLKAKSASRDPRGHAAALAEHRHVLHKLVVGAPIAKQLAQPGSRGGGRHRHGRACEPKYAIPPRARVHARVACGRATSLGWCGRVSGGAGGGRAKVRGEWVAEGRKSRAKVGATDLPGGPWSNFRRPRLPGPSAAVGKGATAPSQEQNPPPGSSRQRGRDRTFVLPALPRVATAAAAAAAAVGGSSRCSKPPRSNPAARATWRG